MYSAPEHAPLGFFGRDRELGRILELAGALREGDRGRAVLVTGPAGVGKSRLMAELKRRLREEGEVALECWCRHTDPRPHGPLVDLLAAGAASMAEVGRRATRTERALNLVTGLAPDEAGSAITDRTPAFRETVRQALIELADVHPSVLFLHDLHWADRATLELVRYLLENLLTDPAFDWTPPDTEADPEAGSLIEPVFRGLLVVSFRESQATAPLLEVARATAAVEHVPLAGLDADAIRAFLASPGVVERIIAASSGMPLALEQIVEAIPSDPAALWQQQIEALPADARALLDVFAVQRQACTLDQVGALGGVADARGAMAVLIRRRIVRRNLSAGIVRFRFARPAAREAWYAAMDPDRRSGLHRAVAERLAAGLGAEPERVARHYLAGRATAEAIPYAIAAADRLQSCFAHTRAAALLEDVVDCAEGPLRAEILDRLAELYAAGGDPDAARRALRALATADPDRAGPALDARRARLMALAGAHAEARDLAERTLDEPDVPPDVRRRLRGLAADAAYRQGDIAAAAALAGAVDGAVDAVLLDARNTLGKAHIAREALDEAAAIFTRNLELSARPGLADHQARALINLGVVDLQRGDVDAALARFEAARQLCADHNDLPNLSISLENLAVLHHRRQAYSRALSYYHQSTSASRRLGRRLQLATTALNLADLYLTVGDHERARRLSDIAGEYIRRDQLGFLEPQRLMLEGDLARADDDLDRALDRYGAAIARIEQGAGSNQRLGPVLCAEAELLLDSGDVDRAEALVDQAAALAATGLAARLHLTRGGILAARGDAEAAVVELEAALHAAESRDDHETVWLARARLAETWWARGDRAETLKALAGAVETIERVAAELPPSMRQAYRDAPRRRAVADALRRVRAGLAPDARLTDESESAPVRRRAGGYHPRWAERYPSIIGRAPSLHPVFNALDRVAGSDSMVLIRGESGTGKELVAAALHQHSPRADGPFVKVNCAAFVETLLLSELFGHEKGAFTGAISSKKGRFELAHGGTLFLDEIGDISPNTQVALLRVLQEGTFERVGGAETLTVDVRVICATHRNLEQMVRDGAFRADLYYRLRGVILELPPLRDRRPDIPLLVTHFLARRPGPERLRFDRRAMASLIRHDWPGNVRELENVVRSVALFADGDTIGLGELMELGDMFRPPDEQDLVALHEMFDRDPVLARAVGALAPAGESGERPPEDDPPPAEDEGPTVEVPLDDPAALVRTDWLEAMIEETGSLSDLKKRIEFEAIARALRASGGNITHAARSLGMKRPRLSQIIHANPDLAEIKDEALEA